MPLCNSLILCQAIFCAQMWQQHSLQCLDTVTWETNRKYKTLHLSPVVLFLNKWWKKTRQNLLTQIYQESAVKGKVQCGVTLGSSLCCHCHRKAQPTERFYKLVHPCSWVLRYKTLYLRWLWPIIHCKNWPCWSHEDTQEAERDRSSYVLLMGDSIITVSILNRHYTVTQKKTTLTLHTITSMHINQFW